MCNMNILSLKANLSDLNLNFLSELYIVSLESSFVVRGCEIVSLNVV